MKQTKRILIMGASYGSLLAIKLLAAGNTVHLVGLPAEARLFNTEGARVRIPIRGRTSLLEIDSRVLPGVLSAGSPAEVNPLDYDLVVLAMQEPQYGAPSVRELLQAVAKGRVPCMSIMNMPPLPYLARLRKVDATACRSCYTDATVWDGFDPGLMTLCSPDPQAFRPPDEASNVLQVRLPTNFKAARFEGAAPTELLRTLESGIQAARFDTPDGPIEAPVKLRVYDSVWVPLAKWSMLLTGNYRCVLDTDVQSIKQAVHSDVEASRNIYAWVSNLCKSLGASDEDLVPFDKYASAALSLESPSSAARALLAGAVNIERVDRLVQAIGLQHGLRSPVVDDIVQRVDLWLERNRSKNR